jgi:hypothetical protein
MVLSQFEALVKCKWLIYYMYVIASFHFDPKVHQNGMEVVKYFNVETCTMLDY